MDGAMADEEYDEKDVVAAITYADISSILPHHPEDQTELLAGRHGGWLGRFHICPGRLVQCIAAVRFQVHGWLFRKLILSVHVVCLGIMVSVPQYDHEYHPN